MIINFDKINEYLLENYPNEYNIDEHSAYLPLSDKYVQNILNKLNIITKNEYSYITIYKQCFDNVEIIRNDRRFTCLQFFKENKYKFNLYLHDNEKFYISENVFILEGINSIYMAIFKDKIISNKLNLELTV